MRRKKTGVFIFFICLTFFLPVFLTSNVDADGGIIVPDIERVVFLPEQKAAIFWDGTNETIIISTKIRSDNLSNMAWVLPVPSKTTPEVTQGDIEIFDEIAFEFGEWVGGDYYISYEFCIIAIFIFIISIIGLILILLKKETKFFVLLLVLFVSLLIISVYFGFYIYASSMIGAGDQVYDVEVIDIKKVDIYDIAILKATNASNLVDWLNNNNFTVSSSTIPVLQDYCNQSDFYFIVNKINLTNVYTTAEEIQNVTSDLEDGIATPLQISFQPEQAFYPMRMSSINKGSTSIDVYFISNCSVFDELGDLTYQEVRYANSGSIIPSFDVGDIITFLNYEGDTQDLTEDSYFLEI